MGLLDFLSNQFVAVIDWVEQPGELAVRYPLDGRRLQSGAQLTVREGQIALFHDEGQIADVFGPGLHVLQTSNLPILTALMNWDKAFESPFKSDIYFYATREQAGLTWGTSQAITARDPELGSIAIRAFGRYSFRIADVATFAFRLMGTWERMTITDLEPQLRAAVATTIATSLGNGSVPFADMAADQAALSQRIRADVQPAFALWGLECSTFFVESVSLAEPARPERARRSPDADAPLADDPYAMLRQLHELLTLGAITQAEFDAKKAKLLPLIGRPSP